jgi:hypothetical protein
MKTAKASAKERGDHFCGYLILSFKSGIVHGFFSGTWLEGTVCVATVGFMGLFSALVSRQGKSGGPVGPCHAFPTGFILIVFAPLLKRR